MAFVCAFKPAFPGQSYDINYTKGEIRPLKRLAAFRNMTVFRHSPVVMDAWVEGNPLMGVAEVPIERNNGKRAMLIRDNEGTTVARINVTKSLSPHNMDIELYTGESSPALAVTLLAHLLARLLDAIEE